MRDRLDAMVGLEGVKREVDDLIRSALNDRLRREEGLPVEDKTMHLVFSGAPGTGKTSVAREIAALYYELGLVPRKPEEGFLEVSRGDLIARYEGQTTDKVRQLFSEGKGGVIFVDEAYALFRGENDTYGKEAVTEFLRLAENNREDTVVILAGYTKEMDDLMESNSGLRRRFPRTIEFASYTVPERVKIASRILASGEYMMGDRKAATQVKSALADAVRQTGEGNAGDVRNLVEYILREQTNRVWTRAASEGKNPSKRDLQLILPEDVRQGTAAYKTAARVRNPIAQSQQPVKPRGRRR